MYMKNQKKDTAEIHLMFTANEEIKEGKFMTHKLWLKTVFELIIFFFIFCASANRISALYIIIMLS